MRTFWQGKYLSKFHTFIMNTVEGGYGEEPATNLPNRGEAEGVGEGGERQRGDLSRPFFDGGEISTFSPFNYLTLILVCNMGG